MSAVMSAMMSAGAIAALSAVLVAQEPVAPRPVHTRPPIDSVSPAADSAHLDSIAQATRHTRCWRARPMPDCRMVFLTDIGFEFPLYTTATTSPDPHYSKSFPFRAAWSIGLMRNGDRHSHGVSLGFATESSRKFPQIVEYRYRSWLGRGSALDASIGWKRNSVWQDGGHANAQGMTFLLGYTPSRWVGANVRYDLVNAGGRTHRGVMLGIQSTRVSEYTFKFLALAIVDGLLAKIGIERDTGEEEQPDQSG
jgi:hypothetical protein